MRNLEAIRTDLQLGRYAAVINEIESYQTNDPNYLKYLCDGLYQSRQWGRAAQLAIANIGKDPYFNPLLVAHIALNGRDLALCQHWLDIHRAEAGEDLSYLICASKLAVKSEQFRRAKSLGNKVLSRKDKAMTSARQISRVDLLPGGTKKIVAFSLFGNRKPYTHGAIINAHMWHRLAPDWTVRVYVSSDVDDKIINALRFQKAEVIPVDDPGIPPYFYRFLVLQDPNCQRFLCRDADCRPSVREIEIVREWEQSGKDFHLIRNHLLHTDLILAGLWGGKPIANCDLRSEIAAFYPLGPTNKYGQDQRFLEHRIWPLIRNNLLVHDEHFRNIKYLRRPVGDPSIGKGFIDEAEIDHFLSANGIRVT